MLLSERLLMEMHIAFRWISKQKIEDSKAYYKQIVIEHISLETRHTQMDCDLIYSLIERSIKGTVLYFPQYYVEIIKSLLI